MLGAGGAQGQASDLKAALKQTGITRARELARRFGFKGCARTDPPLPGLTPNRRIGGESLSFIAGDAPRRTGCVARIICQESGSPHQKDAVWAPG